MAMDMIDDELPEERKMNETKKIATEADKLSRECEQMHFEGVFRPVNALCDILSKSNYNAFFDNFAGRRRFIDSQRNRLFFRIYGKSTLYLFIQVTVHGVCAHNIVGDRREKVGKQRY